MIAFALTSSKLIFFIIPSNTIGPIFLLHFLISSGFLWITSPPVDITTAFNIPEGDTRLLGRDAADLVKPGETPVEDMCCERNRGQSRVQPAPGNPVVHAVDLEAVVGRM